MPVTRHLFLWVRGNQNAVKGYPRQGKMKKKTQKGEDFLSARKRIDFVDEKQVKRKRKSEEKRMLYD